MKFFTLAFFSAVAAALSCEASACKPTGVQADVPPQVTAYQRISQNSSPEECLALCQSPEYSACKAFAVRQSSGGGSCLLYDIDVTPSLKIRPSVYTFYVLPAGVRGDVPENVAQHYYADISKTKGNYADCRALCLSDARCRGFGYRDGGNCQLYDVSLAGKVKAKETSLYIQYQADCAV